MREAKERTLEFVSQISQQVPNEMQKYVPRVVQMAVKINEANVKSQVFNLERHFLVLEFLGRLSSIYGASLHQAVGEIAFHNSGDS